MFNRFFRGVLLDPEPEQAGGTPSDGGLPDISAPPPQDDELAQLRARVAEYEAKNRQYEQRFEALRNQPVPQQPRQVVQPPTKADAERTFWQQPLETVAGAVQYAQQNTLQQVAPALAEVARDKARQSDPELWDALEPQINARINEFAAQNPQAIIYPQLWQNVFNTIKGENVEKVLQVKGKKTEQASARQDGPITPGSKPSPAPRTPQLTDEERKWARKFKRTDEQYLQGKDFIENPDKWWGQMFTFDSDEPKIERNKPRANR